MVREVRGHGGETRYEVEVEPGSKFWHDKSLRGRPFTCQHCGKDGWAGEADAKCTDDDNGEGCGRITRLPITVRLTEEDYQDYKQEQRND